MKIILMVLALVTLLSGTGCAYFHGHRDNTDAAGVGVDHGEHPGDLDHGDTMQK